MKAEVRRAEFPKMRMPPSKDKTGNKKDGAVYAPSRNPSGYLSYERVPLL